MGSFSIAQHLEHQLTNHGMATVHGMHGVLPQQLAFQCTFLLLLIMYGAKFLALTPELAYDTMNNIHMWHLRIAVT